jgi:ABC-type transport system involved in multi-copper enzyme maturation permease subunit
MQERMNPITSKELRLRIKNPRTHALLTIFLCVIGGIALMLYIAGVINETRRNTSSVGQTLYFLLAGMQLIFVGFVVPAFTATSISDERERQSYDLLQVSLVSSRQIVFGKLLPALGQALLMILATLPLFSLSYILGGIEPIEILITIWIILVSSILFACIGLFVSSLLKSNIKAVIMSYLLSLCVLIGLPVLALIFSSVGATFFTSSPTPERLFVVIVTLLTSLSPISALVSTELNYYSTGSMFVFNVPISGASSMTLVPPFIVLTVGYLLLSLLMLWLAAKIIAKPQ